MREGDAKKDLKGEGRRRRGGVGGPREGGKEEALKGRGKAAKRRR